MDRPADLPIRVPDGLRVPHPDRLDPEHPRYGDILHAHDRALAAGHDAYLDPATMYSVFTAQYLWERGTCCDIGCRHCPYLDLDERL